MKKRITKHTRGSIMNFLPSIFFFNKPDLDFFIFGVEGGRGTILDVDAVFDEIGGRTLNLSCISFSFFISSKHRLRVLIGGITPYIECQSTIVWRHPLILWIGIHNLFTNKLRFFYFKLSLFFQIFYFLLIDFNKQT